MKYANAVKMFALKNGLPCEAISFGEVESPCKHRFLAKQNKTKRSLSTDFLELE